MLYNLTMSKLKQRIKKLLVWSQKYTQTDMIYIAKGGFWLLLGNIIVFLLSFATMVAFSRWIPKETFGAYQYIISLVAILAIFTLPGMNTPLVRAIAKGKDGMLLLCAKTKLKWGSIGTGICLIGSLWYFFHQNFILGTSFLIASFLFPLPRVFNLSNSFWGGRKRFDIQNKYLIIINILEAAVLIPVIFLTNNLILIMLSYFVSRALFRGIFFNIALKNTKNQEKDKETVSFGKHLTLMKVVTTFADKLDYIILWQFLGPISVAIYSFAQLSISRIKGIIPITDLAMPKLSEKNIKDIKKSFLKKFLKLFILFIPFSLFLILILPYLYKILFPQYLKAIPYAQVLALTIILTPFSILTTSLVVEMKKRELYIIKSVTPVLQIILFLILIPIYGIWGVIIAILSTQLFNSALLLYFFKKI